jgi:hypothetical protein
MQFPFSNVYPSSQVEHFWSVSEVPISEQVAHL